MPVLLGALLGMRRSEIFALTWNDIDLENNTISISKAKVQNTEKEYVLKSTKTTSSTRKLPIPALVKEELLSRIRDSRY